MSLDLSGFPFRECEEELIKAKVFELCEHTAIDPGDTYSELVFQGWVWKIVAVAGVLFIIAWMFSIV